jgi:hypothetical protein
MIRLSSASRLHCKSLFKVSHVHTARLAIRRDVAAVDNWLSRGTKKRIDLHVGSG